jgi:lysyl-tRNA synthetase class 1
MKREDGGAADAGDADWVSRFADEVIAEADRRQPGGTIVCASGLSPSGPVHLGNLREVMTPHLVADEIRRRGRACEHLLSWDDFDRFRRVPAGTDAAWAEHIGRPLTSVPAPPGSTAASWAEHYQAPMRAALDELGIVVREVSQTQMYTAGAYREQVLTAMRERQAIDAILSRYRTRDRQAAAPAGPGPAGEEAGSGAAGEDDGASAAGYFPYKPYCSACDRDLTRVLSYDEASTALRYECEACGCDETVLLREHTHGKLVWKVDWPMRWAYEGVVFEPSGVDHSSPGSSFVVGSQIVRAVYGAEPPIGPMYAFVGITGMAKMSSSRGNVPTPSDALEIMETPVLRWLYARRRPNQAFKVAFDAELARLYDEWDAAGRKVAAGAGGSEATTYRRAISTAERSLALTPYVVPFRTLASIADVTTGDREQLIRILGRLDPADPVTDLSQVEPRLARASRWVEVQLPADQRTRVRAEPDKELLGEITDVEGRQLRRLADGLDGQLSLEQLTTLVYAVPKVEAGLPADAQPTPELKALQRSFFSLVYRLLVSRDTGPRLPTLLLAIGADRARRLLTP